MKKGSTVAASTRADRSRAQTKLAMARELMSGAVFARLWPAYLTPPTIQNDDYPALLCVETPIDQLLVYRLAIEEIPFFDWLERRVNQGEKPTDRLPILQALAECEIARGERDE